MNAYFVASIAAKKRYSNHYKLIIKALEELGCTVDETITKITHEESSSQDVGQLKDVYKEVLYKIAGADVFVCDMTEGSPGVAMEVQDAIYRYKKPSLILFHKDKKGRLAAPFLGNPSKLLFIEEYNESNVKDIIRTFLDRAAKKIPSGRFTVRMSEETDEYIEYLRILWKESSKNKVVNRIIEQKVFDDKDYHRFLQARQKEV